MRFLKSVLPSACRRAASFLTGSLLVLGCPAGLAHATPFTLPAGRLALDVNYIYDSGDHFWDGDGNHAVFSLAGKFSSNSAFVGLRYGVIDGLEVGLRTGYKSAVYTASPIHLYSTPIGFAPTGSLTSTIFNFSGQEAGIGDVYVGTSYRPINRSVSLAVETEVKVPTGYRAPSGTLCPNLPPEAVRELVRGSIRSPGQPQVTPDLFCTGATLGDGQVDWLLAVQLGAFISKTRTFIRADLGMNFRFQGPGQQLVSALKVGEDLLGRVVVYVGGRFAYTLNSGDPVGTTIDSALPEAPASAYPGAPYDPTRNQRPEDLDKLLVYNVATRDRSYLMFDAGVIFRLAGTLELRFNYSRALWGKNFPEINSLSLGFAVATQ
jgi:hypothetical protein